MKGSRKYPVKMVLLSSVAALALLAAPVSVEQITSGDIIAKAQADEGGSKGGKGHKGGSAGKGKGGAQGAGGKGGSGMGKGGSGGGHVPGAVTTSDDDSDDKKGPKYMGGGTGSGGSTGGKPVWAQEGIPEVELGRMNVARAPEHVLIRQLNEALASYDEATMAAFYNMSLSDYITALKTDFDAVLRLDSPLMNLALYKDVIINSSTVLSGVTNNVDTLAAIFIGTASDKVVSISADSITALNAILGLPTLSDADAAALAANAEDVREAILTGHES